MIGTTEILIIGGVVLVLFGSAAIPKFFRSIGKAQSEFEKGKREGSAANATKAVDTPPEQESEKSSDQPAPESRTE